MMKFEYINNTDQNEDLYKLCEVWEVWDKESKKCHFITFAGDGYVLESQEDGYNLKNFFLYFFI